MTNKNFLSKIRGLFSASESTDVSLDRRLTVGSPSGLESSTLLKFVSVLVLILTIGSGNMWGAPATYNFSSLGTTGWSTSGTSRTINGISWTYSASTYISCDNSKIQIGSRNNPQTTNWTIQTAISNFGANKKVTAVAITGYVTQNASNSSYDISVGGSSVKSGSFTTSSATYTANSLNVTSGNIVITLCGASNTRALYLSNISVTYDDAGGGCTAPTITAQPTGATYTQNDVATAMSITASGTSVTYQWYSNTSNSTSGASPISGATSSSYTPPTSTVGTKYYYCVASSSTCTTTSNIVSVVVNAPRYTVSFSTGTGNPTQANIQEASGGSGITLPAGPTPACSGDGWVFMGWKESSAQSSSTTAPDMLAAGMTYKPASNCTLYAVYYKLADSNPNYFTKVTSSSANLTSGYYVIYANGEAMNNVITSNKIEGVTQAETSSGSGIISTSTAAIIWIIYKNGTNYQLYNAAVGKYLEVTGENQLALQTSSKGFTLKAFNTSTGQVSLQSVNKTSYQFQYYSGKFSSYGSQSTAIYFYKRGGTYNSNPTCCTALGSINGSVSWSGGNATVSWDAAGGCSSWGLKYKTHAAEDIPANWTSYAGSFGTATGRTSNSTAISGLDAGVNYDFKITGTSDGSVYCSGTVTETKSSTVPKITASSSMTDLGYQEGETPVAQTFTITGTQLTGNLTVTAPSNFLVSLDGSSWSAAGGSKTVTVSTPPNNLGSTTIHVKANSGLSEGADPSGNITISGGGAASVNVAVSATITEACTAPSSVSISGTTKYFGGQTISLTATPSGGVGETSYQWQKKISGVWTDVANGNGISGATSNNLQISSCTHSNSGGYRCIVSTGSTCSTKSHADNTDGYGVHVFSVYGGYVGESWSDEEIAFTSGTTGTATVHLNSGTLYKFHIRSNNGAYYCNGTADYNGDGNADGGTTDGWYVLKTTSNISFGRSSNNYRIYTGPEGDYTITVDIANALTGGDYVIVGITYPTVTQHPVAGYTYFEKPSEWTNVYLYWYTDDNSRLSGWSGTPEITQTTTICGTTYYYTPLGTTFSKVIFKGNGTNQWPGDGYTTTGCSGKYMDKTAYASPAWAAFPTYSISYAGGTGSTGSMSSETGIVAGSSQTLTAFNTIAKAGYTFSCWHADQDVTIGGSTVNEGDDISDGATIQNVCGNITLTAQWTANTNTAYTVKHYQQNIANDDYTEVTGDRQNLTGTTDASVTPAVKSYTGFTAPSTQTVTILGDGSRVVDYYYTRNSYNLTWNLGGGTTTTAGTGIASGVSVNTTSSVKYGTSLTAPTVTKTGYGFSAWSPAKAATMPAEATSYTATWSATNYTITYNLNSGTNPGGAPTGFTIESSEITLPTPTRAGYRFDGWYANVGLTGDVQTTIPAGSTGNKTYWAKWTAKTDTYKTGLHTGESGWTSYASGVTKSGAGYSIPAPSSVSKGATSSCEDTHYHFAGWVADEYKGSPSGHIIAASGTTDATGATYWAVWEKEKAGSAGAAVNTVLFSENWTGVENNTTPSSPSESGSEVYNDATVTYYWEDGGTTTQTYTTGGPNSNANILISKSNGSWTASGIPVGGAATITYTYAISGSGVLAVSTTTANVTVGGSSSGSTITISGNVSTFDLKFENTATGNNNLRLDDIVVKVATQGVSYEDPKAVCEACVATPSIASVSLTGSTFSTTSVPVQATGASAGENCSLAEYGFYWGGSANPTTNETASDNLSTGTFSATLTGPFTIGTTYHYRAFGTNEADNTGYSSDASFTLQNVSFNMHSHGGDAPATQVVPRGLKATAPSTPSETGYTFDGWWDNSSYTGSAWDFSTNTVGSGDLVLHAKWTEKPKYTITLNAGNGTVSADGWTAGDSPTWSKTQANGDEEITLPAASCNCAGWEFQGWAASSVDQAGAPTMTSSGASVLPASNTTYYAVYRQNATGGTTYNKITSTGDLTTGDYLFVADGGYAMQNTVNGKRMDEVSGFTSSNPSQTTDNTSLVWTIAKFNSQVVIKNGSNYLGIDADNTICMTTTPHFFTYTYNAGSSRWEFTSVTKTSYQLTYSTAAGTSYSYFCAGTSQSTAIYLYKQGAGLTGNYKTNPICSDITVTGAVSPAGSGTVTLTAGSGKTGDKVYAMYTPDEDYNFDHWSISGTGSTLSSTTALVTEITIGSAATTVTANFVAKDWKTVTWKANGVALTGGDLGSASVKVENGFDITALPPTPTSCDGTSTTFIGWLPDGEEWSSTLDDVSAKHIYAKASDFPTVTANVTYHAVWARQNGSAAPATYAGTGVFTKITTLEELEVGAHYVLYGTKDDDASVKGAMNNTFTVEASGKNVFGASAVTISDNKITNPATTIVWKLGGTTNAYTLYSQNSSKYVEITANDTRGYTNPSSPTTSFTITVSEGNFKIITNYASASSRMITIYTASVFRSYSYLTEGYTLNLYKYGSNYTYDQYLVKCCTDPELAFDGEYNYQTLVRQDIHGAHGGNGSATVEQGKATLVLDYVTESDGTCTVEVKKLTGGDNRSTAVAGSDCSNHTGIAINESTKKVTFDVWTYAGSYPTANGQGTYRIKITQAGTATYCDAVTYYFVDVTLRDKFVDAVNGNTTINVDGQSKTTSDKCKTPTEASLDADKNDDCHSTTRRFLGWVREDSMDSWYGSSSDRTRDLDDKKDDAALVAPNADIITSGSTWYAIWGIEE